MRSEPALSNYALRGLLSVEYLLTTPEKQADLEAVADDGWVYWDTMDGFAVYRNQNYVPMGFTYQYYLTQEQLAQYPEHQRANLLMRALVLSPEDEAQYAKYLEPMPQSEGQRLDYDTYVRDCDARRAAGCSMFRMTNSGFHAEITLAQPKLVFFSVPYDDGFAAYVNGADTPVVQVDNGLMAVLCPEGENKIDFVYQPDGIRFSRTLMWVALPLWLAYTGYFAWRRRRSVQKERS